LRLSSEPADLLAIYLNDHLAGATGGVELARRLRASNQGHKDFGPPLAELCAEIEADRTTLEHVMERLGVKRDPIKPAAAWIGEKLGRLKLNGRLRGYSPLSRLVELEALAIGVNGKMRMWAALEHTLGSSVPGFDFKQLCERAMRQRSALEELHLEAAVRTLPTGGESDGRNA
jgi:hypothetical protein